MFQNLRADLRRYIRPHGSEISFRGFVYLLFTQEIWAIIVYRFGSWTNRMRIPVFLFLFKVIYFFANKVIEITTGIQIDSNAKIAKGLYIGHFGSIHIEGTIGENCSIAQEVTIGYLGFGKRGLPKIGNNVFIGAGAKILGDITIGDNVRIGANAVVRKSIPDNSVVAGVPVRVLKKWLLPRKKSEYPPPQTLGLLGEDNGDSE